MPGLADNLARVRERLAQAAARSGRDPHDVTLVAVTKGRGEDVLRGLWTLGLRDFGENRVQEALPKMAWALPDVRWHLIGHLQENKILKILPHVHLLHSLDSPGLAAALEVRASRAGRRLPVLLEVKTSPEPTKHGVDPAAAADVYGWLVECAALEPRGLMTIAPFGAPEAVVRACFAQLRELGASLRRAGAPAETLSMGMSDDFEWAVAEGSTMVRIGRALVAG